MYNFAKRVTSAVVAGAVVLGTLAFYPGWNKGKVNAAQVYDSASAINYATVLGGAVDYGIVADTIVQTSHTETTFATNHFVHDSDDVIEVDYITSPALFLVGKDLTGSDPRFFFGNTKASSVVLEAPQRVFENEVYGKYNSGTPSEKNKHSGPIWFSGDYTNKPFIQAVNENAYSNVDRLLNRVCTEGKVEDAENGWSYFLNDRATDPDYVIDSSRVKVEGGKLVVNVLSPEFDGKVIYVNISDASQLSYLETSGGFIIRKRPSSVVVVNITDSAHTGSDALTIKKPIVGVDIDGDGTISGSSENLNTEECFKGSTDTNGKDTNASRVQQYYNESVIWNIMESSDVNLEELGGAVLLPKTSNVTLSSGNSSGWVVTNGTFNMKNEFHFLYSGSSTDSYGQMHFALTKAFTNQYEPHGQVIQNTSIAIADNDYKFSFVEYSDNTFTTTYDAKYGNGGFSTEADVKSNGTVTFSSLTFYCDPSKAPGGENDHYYIAKPGVGSTNFKMYYFRITENSTPSKPGISNSEGEVDIILKVVVDSAGKFTYFVDYQSIAGKNDPSDSERVTFRQYNQNEGFGEYIKMSGVQFDLGAFYNKVDTSLKINKVVTGYTGTGDEHYAVTVLNTDDNKYYDGDGNSYTSEKTVLVPANGSLFMAGLPAGTYTITEVSTPDHPIERPFCNLVDTTYSAQTVTIPGNGNDVPSVTVTNIYDYQQEYGTLKFTKTFGGDVTEAEAAGDDLYFVVQNVTTGFYLNPVTGKVDSTAPVHITLNDLTDHTGGTKEWSRTFDNVPVGKYVVTETNENITIAGTSTPFTLSKTSVLTDDAIVAGTTGSDIGVLELSDVYYKGSLTIKKQLPGNLPSEAYNNVYKFTVTGPNGYSEEVEIPGAGSKTLKNLELGDYVVTEKTSLVSIESYTLTVTGDNNQVIELVGSNNDADRNKTVTIINTYTEVTTGSLQIKKVLSAGSPAEAVNKEYTFKIQNSDGTFSKEVKITGANESEVISNLAPGYYTITELNTGVGETAQIDGYSLSINVGTGDNGASVEVKKGDTTVAEVTNTYTRNDSGSIYIHKKVSGNKTWSEVKQYLSFTVNNGTSDIATIEGNATGWVFDDSTGIATYTINNVPLGTYSVTESNSDTSTTYTVVTTSGTSADPTDTTNVVSNLSISSDGDSDDAYFTNAYTTTTSTKGTIVITKTIEGPVTTTDRDNLIFEVYEAGTTTNPVWTGKLGENTAFDCDSATGKYTSKPIEVDASDYYVVEKLTTSEGTVTVTYKLNNTTGTPVADYANKTVKTEVFNVVGGTTAQLEFKNTYATGTLVINKRIDGLTDTSVITASAIKFKITGPAAFNSGTGEAIVDCSQFTNGSYTLTGVPAGVYKVEETANGSTTTYTLISTTVNGNTETSATLDTIDATNNTVEFDFVNTYQDNSAPDKGTIVITKTIEGPVTPTDRDNLTFEVYEAGTTTNPVWTGKLGEDTAFDCDAATGKYTSKPIEVVAGDYYVVEKLTTPEGTVTVTYTISDGTTTNNGTVIPDYANKQVKTSTVVVNANETQTLSFKNTYLTGYIKIVKVVEGVTNLNDVAPITFTVTNKDDNSDTIEIPELKNDNLKTGMWVANGNTYTYVIPTAIAVGKVYTVTESAPSSKTVGNTIYKLDTTASDTDDVEVTVVAGNMSAATEAKFKNVYSSSNATGSLSVKKIINTNGDGIPSDVTAFIITVTFDTDIIDANVTSGTKAGKVWTITAVPGTTYTISGVPDGAKYTVEETGVFTTSTQALTSEYKVTYTNATGTIDANAKNPVTSIVINKYTAKTPDKGYIQITKTISGDVTTEDLSGLTFRVLDGTTEIWSGALGSATDFPTRPSSGTKGDYASAKITVPDASKTYTVEESLYTLDGFTVNVSYKVDGATGTLTAGGTTTAPTQTTEGFTASTDADKPTVVAYTNDYTKNVNNNSSLEIKKTIVLPAGASYSDIGTITFDVIDTDGNTIVATVTLNPSNPGTDWNVNGNEFTYTVSPVTEGKQYTVKETCDTTSTTYTATSDVANGESSIVIPVGTPGSVAFTNTYSTVTVYTGSLVITKTIELPSGASMSDIGDITFTISPAANGVDTVVLDPDNPGTGWTVNGNVFTYTIDGLSQGDVYDIKETVDGSTSSYSVKASGDGQVTIPTDANGNTSVSAGFTNTYSSTLPTVGYIEFTKTFGGDVTEAEAAGCGLYFVITNEAGEYLDLDGNITSDEVRITLKDMDHTDGTLVWSKTINDVPFDTYYVTEHNEVIYINGGKVPYTFEKTTSVTTDHTTLWNTSEDGYFDLENYYTHPGFDVTISKEDIAGKEIAQAQLKFKSLDGYDLSKVVVTQNGVPVQFTLSENNTAITFTTIEGYPSIIQGLFSGRYELEETVTPEAYLTAEKIVFVLNNDGTITDGEGKISAYGSPVVMIDQADPYYDTEVISANRTPNPIPATGEKSNFIALVGIALVGLCSAALAGLGVYRKKRNEF